MPGAGKSTLGVQLADTLLLPFIDLDKELERQEGSLIPELFREKGEEYFRRREAELIRHVSGQRHSYIMATGGGAPCFHDTLAFMKQDGIVAFLDIPLSVIQERVKNSTDRPLLLHEDAEELMARLTSLRDKRLAVYQQAHITLSGKVSVDTAAQALLAFKKESRL